MLWRGIAIGVIISAPMGPVGILCLQRTLEKGRRTGFYTGVGASISDLFYCLLTGFGLSFIEDFLTRNQNIIQLLGSVVLIIFGVYLFRSNPSRRIKPPSAGKISPHKNILGGFLFTFSNPLIIFLIIGLFARFNFLSPDLSWGYYVLGYIAIVIGALLWWWIITFGVSKVRTHFNLRSMWLINKITGGVILIFAAVGIITAITALASARRMLPSVKTVYYNSERGFRNLSPTDTDTELILPAANGKEMHNIAVTALKADGDFLFSARVTPVKWSRKCSWSFILLLLRKTYLSDNEVLVDDINSNIPDTLRFTIGFAPSNPVKSDYASDLRDKFTLDVNLSVSLDDSVEKASVDGDLSESSNIEFYEGLNVYGTNAWKLERKGSQITLSAGNRRYNPVMTLECDDVCAGFGVEVSSGPAVEFSDIILEVAPERESVNPLQRDSLYNTLSESQRALCGEWGWFDGELDETRHRQGGKYRLRIVPCENKLCIVYVSGAVKNSKEWRENDVKGYLEPAVAEGIYDVIWINADKSVSENALQAQLLNDGYLRFSFDTGESFLLQRLK